MQDNTLQSALGNVPEVPASNVPSLAQPEAAMSQEDMRANLENMFSKVKGQIDSASGMRFAANTKFESKKKDVVRAVFDQMVEMGVDPSNMDSVQKFMEKLKTDNPDLYELFESSLESLLGGSTDGEAQSGMPEEAPIAPPVA